MSAHALKVMSGAIDPANSWAAAMDAIKPRQEPRIPETSVDGLPAFRCVQADAPRGKWQYRCTCGRWHVHSAREGTRKAECDQHPRGVYLLPPHGFIPAQVPANPTIESAS